jgi:Leucine-rich repeat (LRR) protein
VAKKLEISTRKTHIIGVFSVDKTQSKSLSDIKVFHAYNPKLRYIPKNLGLNFVNLHTISITRSELCVLEFRDFRYMKKLKKLYLAENKIEKVTSCVFRYVDTIEIINLDGNMIKALDDDTFVNLPDLHEFSANRNQIEILESGLFRNNLNLKKISLNRNRIHIVEINFLRMLNLELIDMQRNPCTNLIFKTGDLLREFQNQTSGSCKGPEDS